MLIFLFIVTICISANLYFLFKLIHVLNLGMPFNLIAGLIVFFMTVSLVLIPIYSNKGPEKPLRIFSYTVYMWLAFLVPFFPSGIVLDLYNIVIQFIHSATDAELNAAALSVEKTFYFPFVLSLVVNIYGYFEARHLCIERLVIRTSKLPEGLKRIRVAQISDLHLGIILQDKILNKVIRKLEAEKPDIVVSTGDLVDGVIRHISHLAGKLENIKAPLGKYAVMGNHEIYGGPKQTAAFIKSAGFSLLLGEGISINNIINIAGMDFMGGEAKKIESDSPQKRESQILSQLPKDIFTVLLKHRSDVETDSLGLFDLQLSGHTHKGQIFPMNLATMFLFRYHSGLTKLPGGAAIYVSRGTGTAGPPVRFLSTPEITIIDIVPE